MPGVNRKSVADAEERLRSTGERVTVPRVRVLEALLQAGGALTHQEIEVLLGSAALDRVTLYRVLDWLCVKGLAHRMSGGDRVWRFSAIEGQHGRHAHFECRHCGKVTCLDKQSTDELAVNVPRGFRSEGIELTVRGRCAQCA